MPGDQPTHQSSQPMLCIGCGYSLKGLDQHRCPECGREFNPDDSNSFAVPTESFRVSFSASALIIGAVTFLPALVVLVPRGRWMEIPTILTPRWILPQPFDQTAIAIFATGFVITIAGLLGRYHIGACMLLAMICGGWSMVMAFLHSLK